MKIDSMCMLTEQEYLKKKKKLTDHRKKYNNSLCVHFNNKYILLYLYGNLIDNRNVRIIDVDCQFDIDVTLYQCTYVNVQYNNIDQIIIDIEHNIYIFLLVQID